ncbi:MAG: hypothetical protein ACI9MR_003937 [Myxococcota bacterium]|jgi:hypothetical protein
MSTAAENTATEPRPSPQGSGRFARMVQRISDRSNPIVVRYLRQQLRSRAFVIVYCVVLALAALFSIGVGASASDYGRPVGMQLVGLLAILWTFAVWVFEPLNAYRAVAAERDDDTWDLLRLTGLPPGRILRGMLLASLIQGVIYAAAVAPFLVMAYLLRGIDLGSLLAIMVFIPVCGLCASAGAIFMGCLGVTRAVRVALFTLVAVVCGLIWFIAATAWAQAGDIGFLFFFFGVSDNLLPIFVVLATFAAVWVATALVLGAAVIQRPSANRSTGPRVLAYTLPLVYFVWAMIGSEGKALEALCVTGVFTTCIAFFLGIFAIAEGYDITPRQARSLRLMKFMPSVFGSGGGRGRLAYVLLTLLGVAMAAIGASEGRYGTERIMTVGIAAASYSAVILCFSDWIARRQFKFKTALARRATTLGVLASLTFIGIIGASMNGGHLELTMISPIPGLWTFGEASHYQIDDAAAVLAFLGIACLAVLLIQGIRHSASHEAKSRTREVDDASVG